MNMFMLENFIPAEGKWFQAILLIIQFSTCVHGGCFNSSHAHSLQMACVVVQQAGMELFILIWTSICPFYAYVVYPSFWKKNNQKNHNEQQLTSR